MPTPSLKKEMLLEAGWLREKCSEALSATCPSCGSPIDLTSGSDLSSARECWVCTWKGTPSYQCAKCTHTVESPNGGGERMCQSVFVFESKSCVAFQPEGEVWFHRKSVFADVRVSTAENLQKSLASGELEPTTLVCQAGSPAFQSAVNHPRFAQLLPERDDPPSPIVSPVPPQAPSGGGVKGWLGAFFVFLLVASTIAGIFWTFGSAAETRRLLHQWLPRVSAMDMLAFHATSVAMLVVAEWILLLALLKILNSVGLNPSKSSYSSLLNIGGYGSFGVFFSDDLFHFSAVVKWAQTYLIVASGWEWLGVAPINWILCAFFFCVWLSCSLFALIPPGALLKDDPDKLGPVGS